MYKNYNMTQLTLPSRHINDICDDCSECSLKHQSMNFNSKTNKK